MHNGNFQPPTLPSGNSGNTPRVPTVSSSTAGNPGQAPPPPSLNLLELSKKKNMMWQKTSTTQAGVLSSPSTHSEQSKPILIIDFEGLFYMGREAFKVEEIGKELHILLKFVKLIFLTQNAAAAKKLLTDQNMFHTSYNDPLKCEFVVQPNSFEKKQYVINKHLCNYLSTNARTLPNKNQLMLVVLHNFREELPLVDESSCRLILINKSIRSMRSTDEAHILTLKNLVIYYRAIATKKVEDEKNKKITKLMEDAIQLKDNPQVMKLRMVKEAVRGQLELVGVINTMLQQELENLELQESCKNAFPDGYEVVPTVDSSQIYESFSKALASLGVNFCSVEEIKAKVVSYLSDLDKKQNWVRGFLNYNNHNQYDNFIRLMGLSTKHLSEMIELGEGGFTGFINRDELAVDCRLICILYNVVIHVSRKETDNTFHHFIVDEHGCHDLDPVLPTHKDSTKTPDTNNTEINVGPIIQSPRLDLQSLNSQQKVIHLVTYSKQNKYLRLEKVFIPVLPLMHKKNAFNKPTDEINFDLSKFEQKVLSLCTPEDKKMITENSVPEFAHFLLTTYELFEIDTEEYDTQNKEKTNKNVALKLSEDSKGNPPLVDTKNPPAIPLLNLAGSRKKNSPRSDTLESGIPSPRVMAPMPTNARANIPSQLSPRNPSPSNSFLLYLNDLSSPSLDRISDEKHSPRPIASILNNLTESASKHLRKASQEELITVQSYLEDNHAFLNFLRDMTVLFKKDTEETTNNDRLYWQFIQRFFLILADTMINVINNYIKQYADELRFDKDFVTCFKGQFRWCHIKKDPALFSAEIRRCKEEIKKQLIIWIETLKEKAKTKKPNKLDFLQYSLEALQTAKNNLDVDFENYIEQFSEAYGVYTRKAGEINKVVSTKRRTYSPHALLTQTRVGATLFENRNIFQVCIANDFDQFKMMLASAIENRFNINDPYDKHKNPDKNLLQIACYMGFYEIVALLLENMANVNYRLDETDSPPIYYIIEHLNLHNSGGEILRLLLESGVETVIFDANGLTPLHFAEEEATKVLLNHLLILSPGKLTKVIDTKSRSSKSDEKNPSCSPLYHAVINLKSNVVSIYFSYGVLLANEEIDALIQNYLNEKNEHNMKVLILLDTMSKLNEEWYQHHLKIDDKKSKELSYEKPPAIPCTDKLNADVEAEELAWLDRLGLSKPKTPVKRFLSMFTSPRRQSDSGSFKLPVQNVDTPRLLTNATDTLISPRERAASASLPEAAPDVTRQRNLTHTIPGSTSKPVLTRNNSLSSLPNKRGTATVTGNKDETGINEINLNLLSYRTGFAVIHIACITGNCELLDKLLQLKVNLSLCSKEGFTPYFYAALYGHTYIMEKLSANNALLVPDVTELDKIKDMQTKNAKKSPEKTENIYDINWTPLHAAVETNDPKVFEAVLNDALKQGCYECIYRRDKNGCTPLLFAAMRKNKRIMELCRNRNIWFSHKEDGQVLSYIEPRVRKEIFLLMKEVFEKSLKEKLRKYMPEILSPRNNFLLTQTR